MKKSFYLLMFSLTLILPDVLFAQSANDTVLTLKTCIDYALRNQPAVRQASIDQEINEKNIRIGLADWLPQVSTSDFYQHYFNGGPIAPIPASGQGMRRSEFSSLSLQASQVVYNNNVLQAAKAAKYSRLYYQENTLSSQINVVSDVSKAFFDVLLSEKQLEILNEDIIRLQRSLKDAYNRYLAGIVDKTDYKQATISLNIVLSYDSTHYEQEAYIDTLQKLDVNNRIEYRLLQTQKNLDNINVSYYKWGFLPSVSLQGNYSSFYSAGRFSNLYDNPILNSYAGITLNMPIFQGTKRLQNLSKARLQVNRADLDIENSANTINTEYAQALAGYKSNYTNWKLIGQNVDLAKDVYKVVSLQYREGIKTYLDVIIALSDLRTAELNYYNALFQLLSSKIDLEKAMGVLNVQ